MTLKGSIVKSVFKPERDMTPKDSDIKSLLLSETKTLPVALVVTGMILSNLMKLFQKILSKKNNQPRTNNPGLNK